MFCFVLFFHLDGRLDDSSLAHVGPGAADPGDLGVGGELVAPGHLDDLVGVDQAAGGGNQPTDAFSLLQEPCRQFFFVI